MRRGEHALISMVGLEGSCAQESAASGGARLSAWLTCAPGCCMVLYPVSLRIEGYSVRLIQRTRARRRRWREGGVALIR